MSLIQTAALCALAFPGPGAEPPAPPKPNPGVGYARVNPGGIAGGPLDLMRRHASDAAMSALLRAVPKLKDLLGPTTLKAVPWHRKVSALLALREGKDGEYKLVLRQFAEVRDEANDRYTSKAKTASKLERELKRGHITRPDSVRTLQQNIESCRRSEAWWRDIEAAKVREEAALEKLGRAVIRAREEEKRAPSR